MGRRRAARQARASKATTARYAELAIALVAFLLPLFRKALAARTQQQAPPACPHHQELAEAMRDDCAHCTELREQQAKAKAQQGTQGGNGGAAGDAVLGAFSVEKMLKVIIATYTLIAGYDRRSSRKSKKRSTMPMIMGGLMKAGYSMFTATMNAVPKS